MEIAAKDILNILNSPDGVKDHNDLNKLESSILDCIKFLPQSITSQNYQEICNQTTIDGFLYGKIIQGLLQLMEHNRPLHDKDLQNLIETLLIVDGSTFQMLHELLEVLSDCLKKISNERTIGFIVSATEKVIKSDAIYSAIIHASCPNNKNPIEAEELIQNWREFLQVLVSLPNHIANKTKGKFSDTFTLDIYSKIMIYHILRAISFINDISHKFSFKPNFKILSSTISKIVLILGVHKFNYLFEILTDWSLDATKNMQDFIKNILCEIDGPSTEPIAVLILKIVKVPSNIHKILQDLLNINQWRHALLTKIPLLSYYDDELLISNLIYYLACPQNGERVLIDLLIRLLDIWGDRSALYHTSVDQHEYITKLILLSTKTLRDTLKPSDKDHVKRLLFDGTTAHLESMQIEIRAIGMITGELIIEFLSDPSDSTRLQYEYDSMPEAGIQTVDRIRKFINNDNEKSCESQENNENNSFNDKKTVVDDRDRMLHQLGIECHILPGDNKESIKINRNVLSRKSKNPEQQDSCGNKESVNEEKNDSDDLDSDDDLIPYDMSNDTKITNKLRPRYLRDLKQNLINTDANKDPDIFSESLQVAEELILSQLPNDDPSLAIELLEILTTLDERVYVENFDLLKYHACVAIVTVYPKQCATYLCTRFHSEVGQHSVSDRIFFLNILSESARRLSQIEIKPNANQENNSDNKQIQKVRRPKKPISLFIDVTGGKKFETLYDENFEVSTTIDDPDKSNWEEIVERRIQSNTKIFAHKSKRPQTTINKFNDVAASFFYPLLYGLSQKTACLHKIPNLYLDLENLLLIHFLKTLSVIMVSAKNCVIAPKIGLDILELALTLRYHEQANVRLCVMQNIASVTITLSEEAFTTEIGELLLEFRTWLFDTCQDSMRGDPDKDCRNLGKNVVALIDSVIGSMINKT